MSTLEERAAAFKAFTERRAFVNQLCTNLGCTQDSCQNWVFQNEAAEDTFEAEMDSYDARAKEAAKTAVVAVATPVKATIAIVGANAGIALHLATKLEPGYHVIVIDSMHELDEIVRERRRERVMYEVPTPEEMRVRRRQLESLNGTYGKYGSRFNPDLLIFDECMPAMALTVEQTKPRKNKGPLGKRDWMK